MSWRPARERLASRTVRFAAIGVLGGALSLLSIKLVVPLTARVFVRGIELVMNACIWFAMSLSVGMSLWSMVDVVGRHVAGVMSTRQASLVLTLLMAVGGLAAYGLQRLLGTDEESRR